MDSEFEDKCVDQGEGLGTSVQLRLIIPGCPPP